MFSILTVPHILRDYSNTSVENTSPSKTASTVEETNLLAVYNKLQRTNDALDKIQEESLKRTQKILDDLDSSLKKK